MRRDVFVRRLTRIIDLFQCAAIYGRLPIAAIVWVRALELLLKSSGIFVLALRGHRMRAFSGNMYKR